VNPVANKPLLSVIITSYTTEKLKDIFELLDSIKAQTLLTQTNPPVLSSKSYVANSKPADIGSRTSGTEHPLEVIFIAERSKELYERVKEYGEKILGSKFQIIGLNINSEHRTQNLEYGTFVNGESGASAARNLGIKHATSDVVAFVDDDVVLFPDWAEQMIKSYENDSIIGATGPAYPLWEDESMSWFPEEFHWIISCTSWFNCDNIREVRNVWLENASFRREAFRLAGLLDTQLGPRDSMMGFKGRELKEKLISEEVEFSLRVKKKTGKRIVYNPQVKVFHKVYNHRLKWKYIVQWSFWIGASKRKLKKLYDKTDIGMEPIEQEKQLLNRILFRLFPKTAKDVFKKPIPALRIILWGVIILFFVGLGYFSIPTFPRVTMRRIVARRNV
jgi:glycosyltransferase involved in cell wall biosynthesis